MGTSMVDGESVRPTGDRAHALLVHADEQRRRDQVADWLTRALTSGEKVLYKPARTAVEVTSEQSWIIESGCVSGAAEARASGQLDLIDPAGIFEATGGMHRALLDYHILLIEQAMDEGYPRVAMSAEAPALHAMAPDSVELLELERGINQLTQRYPMHALCQYDVSTVDPGFLGQMVQLHYRNITDAIWRVRWQDGRLHFRGELDASNRERFTMVLDSIIGETEGGDLHLDLAGLRFIDTDSATVIIDRAARMSEVATVVVYSPSATLRQILATLGSAAGIRMR